MPGARRREWKVVPRFAALAAVCLPAAPAVLGSGTDDGFPVCTAAGDQFEVVACPDGTGGAILAWLDRRTGSGTDVYAQRLAPDGTPVWAPDGVPVCTATDDQEDVRILPDGAAGAFLVWQDGRTGDTDLRAVRLTGVGVPEPGWPSDGLVVSDAPGVQGDAALAPDGHGGFYVAWADFRSGLDGNIFLHHVLGLGALDPAWPAGGRPLCTAAGLQRAPAAVAEGGGVVVAWEDGRNGHTDVFAQRLTAADTLAWEPNGHAVSALPGDQQRPALAADGAGGVFVAWQDLRGAYYDLYVHHVTPDLEYEWWWPLEGLLVCGAAGGQFEPRLLADGTGGTFVAWFDGRAGSHYDVYAQRVTDRARKLWESDGRALATAPGDQTHPRLASDGAGGLLVAWTDRRAVAADVYAARLASDGAFAGCWPAGGLGVCTAPGDQDGPAVVSLGRARALVAWSDRRSGGTRDVYARVVSNSDTEAGAWPAGGLAVIAAPGDQIPGPDPSTTAVADGAGGMLVAWRDARPGAAPAVRVQRVDAAGRTWWSAEGVVAGSAAVPGDLQVVADGSGGAYVAWEDARLDASDVVAQHVRGDGVALWPAGGLDVAVGSGLQLAPRLAPDAAGGAFVLWQERSAETGAHFDLLAVRLASDGSLAPGWPAGGRNVCTALGDQLAARILPNGEGGFLAAWLDARSAGPPVLQGIGITASGGFRAGWTADGLRLARGRARPRDLRLVPVATGGAILVWRDGPPGTDGAYALRVTAGGQLAAGWPADGLEAHRAATAHAGLVSGADGSGGALLAWSDEDGGSASVRALRITGDGTLAAGWPAGGRRVAAGRSAQIAPAIVGDGRGGALVGWVDLRHRGLDLYAQHVAPNGELAWSSWVEGVPLCTAAGTQDRPSLVAAGDGCAFAAWCDRRGGDADVFATSLVPEAVVSDAPGAGTAEFERLQVAPNPGRGVQRIEFTLPRPGRVAMAVYDVAGRRVRRLDTAPLAAGGQALLWDGRDDAGRPLAAGAYVVRLHAPGFAAGGKIVRRR